MASKASTAVMSRIFSWLAESRKSYSNSLFLRLVRCTQLLRPPSPPGGLGVKASENGAPHGLVVVVTSLKLLGGGAHVPHQPLEALAHYDRVDTRGVIGDLGDRRRLGKG